MVVGGKNRVVRSTMACALAGAAGLAAHGQTLEDYAAFPGFRQGQPVVRFPLPAEMSTLYATGEKVIADQNEERWRPMCFNRAPLTEAQIRAIRAEHKAKFSNEPVIVVDSGNRGAGINIVFNLAGSVPSAAVTSFTIAEAYLESQFSDPITVTVNVSFANLGSGVIGATSSNFLTNRTYTAVRNGMVNGMDFNDTIQSLLPTGSTVPVRYVGTSATVTNESNIDVTWANYKATIGSVGGSDGDMTYNSGFSFDYDPSDGVPGTRLSLVDTIVHEVGHALGFVSAADNSGGGQFETMDLFRFQRTDGTGDFNPDTNAEFTTTARLVDYNVPNDDHNSDFIWAEHRMSDGTPYQASHFREQSGTSNIGIMDPAIANGQTYYPNYFKTPDTDVFDALGYDYPPGCSSVSITTQPASQTVCQGTEVTLTVAVDGTSPTFQWKRNGTNITGATSASYTISNPIPANSGSYTVEITNACSSPILSNAATLTVNPTTTIITHPLSAVVDEGDSVTFTTSASGASLTYQWRKNFISIPGATDSSYNIPAAALGDAGSYRVSVTGSCGTVVSNEAILTVNDVPDCAADYNGDTSADVVDFLDFLDDYGTCDGQPAPCGGVGDADFNGDTVIDVLDFLDFLDAFGQGC